MSSNTFILPMTPDPGGSRGATKGLSASPAVGVPRCPSWAGLGAGLTSVHLAERACAGHLCLPSRMGLMATCRAPRRSFQGRWDWLVPEGAFHPQPLGKGRPRPPDWPAGSSLGFKYGVKP